jgi:hypothetical protein
VAVCSKSQLNPPPQKNYFFSFFHFVANHKYNNNKKRIIMDLSMRVALLCMKKDILSFLPASVTYNHQRVRAENDCNRYMYTACYNPSIKESPTSYEDFVLVMSLALFQGGKQAEEGIREIWGLELEEAFFPDCCLIRVWMTWNHAAIQLEDSMNKLNLVESNLSAINKLQELSYSSAATASSASWDDDWKLTLRQWRIQLFAAIRQTSPEDTGAAIKIFAFRSPRRSGKTTSLYSLTTQVHIMHSSQHVRLITVGGRDVEKAREGIQKISEQCGAPIQEGHTCDSVYTASHFLDCCKSGSWYRVPFLFMDDAGFVLHSHSLEEVLCKLQDTDCLPGVLVLGCDMFRRDTLQSVFPPTADDTTPQFVSLVWCPVQKKIIHQ